MMLDRRRFLAACGATAFLPQGLFAETKEASGKKGWAGADASMVEKFGANWYYNWGPDGKNSTAKEFVPMIKGERDFGRFSTVEALSGIKHLLGYNEPERKDQGNLTLEKALETWPKLVALADKKNLRLGSPAPSSDGPGMKWLDDFMKEARKRKLRVDFIAVHWYRSRDAGAFETFVKELARSHRLPVWITEFNGWTGPEREHFEFLEKSLKFLERNKDVERYAYFEPGKGKPHSLMNADGSLTRMGELYRSAGG